MHGSPQLHLFPACLAEEPPAASIHAEAEAANRHMMPVHIPAYGIDFELDDPAQGIHFCGGEETAAGQRHFHISLTCLKIDQTIEYGPKLPMVARAFAAYLLENRTDCSRRPAQLQIAEQRLILIIKVIGRWS